VVEAGGVGSVKADLADICLGDAEASEFAGVEGDGFAGEPDGVRAGIRILNDGRGVC
jgi:hypothetical protein